MNPRFLSLLGVAFAWALLLFLPVEALRAEEGVKVRFVNQFNEAAVGQETTIQVYITNQRPEPVFLVGHVGLPEGWRVTPANDILIHLMPNQNIVQRLVLKVPDYAQQGEYPLFYEVWGRDNPNIYDKDSSTVLLRSAAPYDSHAKPSEGAQTLPADNASLVPQGTIVGELPKGIDEKEGVRLSITSDHAIVAAPAETLFISCFIKNTSEKPITDQLFLTLPQGWHALPEGPIACRVPSKEGFLQVFGVKVPAGVIAGRYALYAHLNDLSLTSESIVVTIPAIRQLAVQVETLASCYSSDKPIDLDFTLLNQGNTPLTLRLQAHGEPYCDLQIRTLPIEIAPHEKYQSTMHIEPNLGVDDDKQFILLKALDNNTGDILYQDTLTLRFTIPDEENEDPYLRIQSHLSTIAYGDNNQRGVAVEWGGHGIIDPERERRIEFLFRLPSNDRNVIYNVDERLYLGLSEPAWDVHLGDTVYALSPLTQRYRYGRGGGFDIDTGKVTGGAHYTQNILTSDDDPKETCAYIGYRPIEKLYLSGNYFHRNLGGTSESDIVSIDSTYQLMEKVTTELEVGKNVKNGPGNVGTSAFRFDMRGRVYRDTWFDIEKIYAGADFFGYYSNINVLSGVIDFPVSHSTRANVSMINLRQGSQNEIGHHHPFVVNLNQYQRQYNANITYNFSDGNTIGLNGLSLRAWDEGLISYYNFYQQWLGVTSSFYVKGWSLLGIVSFGRQDDYITDMTEPFLQRYWFYVSRQLQEDLYSSLFVEEGNTNYYDAAHWRSTIGGSLGYRYCSNGFVELFLQKVRNSPDMYELNQIDLKICHTFKNKHVLEVLNQYFNYKSHYKDDYMFYVSYKIPFSIPVGRRKDIGNLSGYIHDTHQGLPVPQALVNVGGRFSTTDANGSFAFKNMKAGTHDVKVEILPKQLITQDPSRQMVNVLGGKNNQVMVPVTSMSSISGEVSLYGFLDAIDLMKAQGLSDQEPIVKKEALAGIRVTISRNNGEEIYTTMTNKQGAFVFANLRPGKWEARLSRDALPNQHYIKVEEFTFDLEPQEEKTVTFEVHPQPRNIRLLSE